MHFLEWNGMDFDYDSTEICSYVSNQHYSSIGSDNGFAPILRQAISFGFRFQVFIFFIDILKHKTAFCKHCMRWQK